MSSVWIFVADSSSMPSGVFEDRILAEAWISKHSLTGLLTEYPLNIGIYDWATSKGLFKPKYPSQVEAKFVAKFTSAYMDHRHYENGEESS